MKQTFTFLLTTFFVGSFLLAQTTYDFEDFAVEQDSFLNGSDGSGGFTTGNIFLPNTFSVFPTFTSWSGWSISNKTDAMTAGFMNQYSVYSGSGYDNSSNFAVAYTAGATSKIELNNEAAGEVVNGFYINNGTYAYLSMSEGDMVAKKFGGESGDDPDYFLLTIKKYLDGQLSDNSVEFYLADYRFDDNSEDYIIDDWTYVDLTSLGAADSLVFSLSSTDVGNYGMNTPSYFLMDNFITSVETTSTTEPTALDYFEVFPNPTSDYVIIKNPESRSTILNIYDITGRKLLSQQFRADQKQIDLSSFSNGAYLLELQDESKIERTILMKQ